MLQRGGKPLGSQAVVLRYISPVLHKMASNILHAKPQVSNLGGGALEEGGINCTEAATQLIMFSGEREACGFSSMSLWVLEVMNRGYN